MDLGIKDRLALVTGAGRGMGRAIAAVLAREGARVALVARTESQLDETLRECGGAGRHRKLVMDLTAEGAAAKLAGSLAGMGEPDIIVHNVGGSMGVTQTLGPSEDWMKVWRFNVGIAHELNRLYIPGMVERRWGRVVHLSTLSTTTYNGYAAYVSAKCALDGYVKTVSREVSKDNVILSAVAPGAIYTEGRFFAKISKEDPAALEDYLKNHLPIRRLGQAQEVAPVVAFLCSEAASFMAGAIVGVDGGGM